MCPIIVTLLMKVVPCGKWPIQASTMIFFLISNNVTSERPTALLPASTRWWELSRAPDIAEWNISWNVASGHVGGAEVKVREALWEIEQFDLQAGEAVLGAATLAVDVAEAFEKVQVRVVWT